MEFFEIFKARVLKHRDIKSEEVFSGRPYTASSAVNLGLIDKIGIYSDAVEEAKKLAKMIEKIKNCEICFINLIGNILGGLAGPGTVALAWQYD